MHISNKSMLTACLLSLASMCSIVQYSKAYAQSHPRDGIQTARTYCMSMQREQNRNPEDIGCIEGRGNGVVGAKNSILRKMAARMNMNKHSYEYAQLVSREGLHLVFHNPALGTRGKATVWQDKAGKLHSVIGNDD